MAGLVTDVVAWLREQGDHFHAMADSLDLRSPGVLSDRITTLLTGSCARRPKEIARLLNVKADEVRAAVVGDCRFTLNRRGWIQLTPVEEACSEKNPCCERANEHNGFSSGPLIFICPKHCVCHD